MKIYDILNAQYDGNLIENLAQSYDSPVPETREAVKVVLDDLSNQLERNTLSYGGLSDLVRALGDGHHQAYFDGRETLNSENLVKDGNAILGHITGSKHASRRLAAQAARQSGLNADNIEKMLPTLAALTMAGLSKEVHGPIADLMKQMTSGSQTKAAAAFSTNDADVGQHQPLPIPGDHVPGLGGRKSSNPFEDFSDVVRNGRRTRVPSDSGGGFLWNTLRQIIGAALGFRSNSVLGWILRFVIYRWGWRIVSSIFRRLFLGR